jgi:hypothetical protein
MAVEGRSNCNRKRVGHGFHGLGAVKRHEYAKLQLQEALGKPVAPSLRIRAFSPFKSVESVSRFF